MRESIAAAKRTAPKNSSTRSGSGRSQTGKNGAARKHAQNTTAYVQETFEKAKTTTEEGNKVLVLELSVAQARKQFESFTEQTQHLAALAQKVAAETVAPLQSGMMSTFNKA
jgi:hypothetical protein